jgi:hypothetical protein
MSEQHTIAGPPRGEPLPEGHVGARIRVPLSGTPSPYWSHSLGAHLSTALTGHDAVEHIHLNTLVQGADIVLEGVTAPQASELGPALVRAVAEVNQASERSESGVCPPFNMSQQEANRIARELDVDCAPAPSPQLTPSAS